MRVVIAGAGSVGRSIARELLAHDHDVVLIDKSPGAMRVAQVAEAEWILADACEISSLADAEVESCDVIVAATGDDKVNLVVSLLAKTEFGVPRTVARVNNPANEWMFDESWGVDVAVSTPRIMTSMVEEAVAVGDLVRIFTFHQSGADILELTLPDDSPLIGARVGAVPWPLDTVLAAVVRGALPFAPTVDDTLEAGDELLIVAGREVDEEALQSLLVSAPPEDPGTGQVDVVDVTAIDESDLGPGADADGPEEVVAADEADATADAEDEAGVGDDEPLGGDVAEEQDPGAASPGDSAPSGGPDAPEASDAPEGERSEASPAVRHAGDAPPPLTDDRSTTPGDA
ncbi:hypothetical protein GCM10025865_26760 [Paraoerskovia sediminicola]|uniref:Trk system potassium uptake protein TrkA n=1 Tax=Paraoerskovia sediminicola TaxID=1138587 RepID=A0ABN6XEU2_9CELL|nr:hypothetical protein GCM10025865_26760 [Paraoerskovia sediminicola]